jgi:hypothetical protein
MPTYLYPTSREMKVIGPEKAARAKEERLGFKIMPTRDVNAAMVEWEVKDNYKGLQQLRGLDGAPASIVRIGSNRYTTQPGVYGEFDAIGEQELVNRAGSAMGEVTVDVSDLVLGKQDLLIQRELDLQEYIIWTLLTTGTFSVTSPGGNVVHTDTFSLQTIASSDWSTVATATPLADLRAAKLLYAGKGVVFNANSRIVMNQVTANYLLNNTNASDLGGKRREGGATWHGIADLNKMLVAEDLPQVEVYDEGYISTAGSFTRFIPTDKYVMIGARRSGEPVGEYQILRNANNPGYAPGSYEKIEDNSQGNKIPATIKVHRGHSGGPAIFWASAIVVGSC